MPFATSRPAVARVREGKLWVLFEPGAQESYELATIRALIELSPHAEVAHVTFQPSHFGETIRAELRTATVTYGFRLGAELVALYARELREGTPSMSEPIAMSWARVCAAANDAGCIAVVTNRTFPRRFRRYSPFLSERGTIELVALHARLQDSNFLVPHGAATATTEAGRDRFYWWLTQAYAPHWAGLIFAFEHAPLELRDLARSCLERVERALRAKDLLAGAIFFDSGRHGNLDAALYFDAWTWTLRAAFDSFGLLLARAYDLPREVLPAWRDAKWRNELFERAPQLRGITNEPVIWPTFQAMTELRNPIHAETSVTDPYARSVDPQFLLPEAAARGLRRYTGTGLVSHGVTFLRDGGALVRPYFLAREMTARTLRALDALAARLTVPVLWAGEELTRQQSEVEAVGELDVRLLGGLEPSGLIN